MYKEGLEVTWTLSVLVIGNHCSQDLMHADMGEVTHSGQQQAAVCSTPYS
jgi:hypothetical protein